MSILPGIDGGRTRWLLLSSLVLNLLFVGAAGAVAFRYSTPVPLSPVTRMDHSLTTRLDRLAASLPPADADVMRAELRDDAVVMATAQADLRLSRDEVRKSLRAQPFDLQAMRAALAANHAAHDNFDKVVHDMIAGAAAKMSVVGRAKLAEWPGDRTPDNTVR